LLAPLLAGERLGDVGDGADAHAHGAAHRVEELLRARAIERELTRAIHLAQGVLQIEEDDIDGGVHGFLPLGETT
jgi:hypothetical protein